MKPVKPYLLRAYYQWMVDSALTPHILVHAPMGAVQNFPVQSTSNDRIVFNLAPKAVQKLEISNSTIEFTARFSGQARHVSVALAQVEAIYAQENGQGISFQEQKKLVSQQPNPPQPSVSKPTLRVVK